LFTANSWAQSEMPLNSATPYKEQNSVLYGGDIIIDDQPLQDQRGNSLAIAFNGWIYASHIVNSENPTSWEVFQSKDDGLTWNLLIDQPLAANWSTVAMDIMVCGTDVATLKLYVARVYENSSTGASELKLVQYNGDDGSTLNTLRDDIISGGDKFLDVAIASDYLFPAWSAGIYSIGMAYSKTTASTDYIGYICYADGGATPQPDKTVYSGGMFTRKVAISYGHSSTATNGRYHIAWEELTYSGADIGQIWTAHTISVYNDDFTAPIRLDNMIGASAGFCRNPSIATQFNLTDNSFGNYSEVVLFDRAYNGNTADFDIVGCYNRVASNSDDWGIFGMYAGAASSDYQPDINFDPAINNFLVTYFNSTETKLRYLVEYMDLSDPYYWIIIMDKYNSGNNLVNPYPKVEISPIHTQVAHLWTGERPGGNGETIFDAEFSTAGIQPATSDDPFHVKVYPNPASSNISILLTLSSEEHITVRLIDSYGKSGNILYEGVVPVGESQLNADVSGLSAGCYFYTVQSASSTFTGRLVILR